MKQPTRSAKEHKWRLVPRVQDIAFFQSVMTSRKRLLSVTFLITCAELLILFIASRWMRETSGTPVLNIFIIATILAGMVVAAYFLALTMGDLFFPGRWRERILQGERFVPRDWEEEEAAVKEYNAPFLLIWLLSLLALAGVGHVITSGFLNYYQNLGFALALMRSEDPNDQLLGLEEIANPIREAQWQDERLHEQVRIILEESNPEVLAKAAYVAGRLGVVRAADTLLRHFREHDDPNVRAEAATALGRMKWEPALAYLSSHLAKSTSEEEQLGIINGIALMKDRRAGPAVARLLESCDPSPESLRPKVVQHALWALAQMDFPGGRNAAKAFLLPDSCARDLSERCAAAESLRVIANNEDIAFLQSAFAKAKPDEECAYFMWRYHEEKSIELVEKEPLRAKILRAVGNRKNPNTYEWIWSVGANEEEHHRTRKVAEIYTREMLKLFEQAQP